MGARVIKLTPQKFVEKYSNEKNDSHCVKIAPPKLGKSGFGNIVVCEGPDRVKKYKESYHKH